MLRQTQGPTHSFSRLPDFMAVDRGQEMPMPMMQTMGPESIERINRKNQEQYIPVPPGQVSQKATYGTPTPDFSRLEDRTTNAKESMKIGQVAPPQQFEYDGPGPRAGMGYQPRPMAQPAQQRGGMFNQPQQRGGMFGQQNQFNPQGMQQMMQFMQQMMQMFSMMGGQNRGGGFGGGFGGQQQYQQPQRYQPQQYQPPPRQQFQPVQQQYGQQMQPQQASPFAQSIRPRY